VEPETFKEIGRKAMLALEDKVFESYIKIMEKKMNIPTYEEVAEKSNSDEELSPLEYFVLNYEETPLVWREDFEAMVNEVAHEARINTASLLAKANAELDGSRKQTLDELFPETGFRIRNTETGELISSGFKVHTVSK